MRIVLLLFIMQFFSLGTRAQTVYFSETQKEENDEIKFEILGRADTNYLIYKNIRWKHLLSWYASDMKLVKSERLKFIPEKTFNVDLVLMPRSLYVIYQYEKGNVVYCYGVKMALNGEILGDPVLLDQTKISIIGDHKIYGVNYSEDRQRILLYKMHLRNSKITIMTKIFGSDFLLQDSSRVEVAYDERLEFYSDPEVANDGTILYSKQLRNMSGENFKSIQIFSRKPGDASYSIVEISQEGKYTDELHLKIDNLNKSYIFNSFYYDDTRGDIKGLFSAVIQKDNNVRTAYNVFDDAIRSSINESGKLRQAFDNLFIKNTFVRKNGSFVLVSEKYSSQSKANDNGFNRWDYLGNYPYSSGSDYFLTNPYYYGYYRPYRSYSAVQSVRYYYDEMLVVSMDSSLNFKWNTIVHKKQFDDDNENYLSFATMNVGGNMHFLFAEDNTKNQIVNNQSISPSGNLVRYPTIKSYQTSYAFMPRLAKQVGPNEMIFPCVRLGSITFAKVIFSN